MLRRFAVFCQAPSLPLGGSDPRARGFAHRPSLWLRPLSDADTAQRLIRCVQFDYLRFDLLPYALYHFSPSR
jgi:hypothetical protein